MSKSNRPPISLSRLVRQKKAANHQFMSFSLLLPLPIEQKRIDNFQNYLAILIEKQVFLSVSIHFGANKHNAVN